MQDIFVFGGGAWGLALAFCFSQKNRVFVLSRRKLELKNYKDSKKILDSNKEPIQLDYDDFLTVYEKSDHPLCVIAIASAFLREFINNNVFFDSIKNDKFALVASKGIERGSGAFASDILEPHFHENNLCYLAGPSFAKEVRAGLPCALVIHSFNKELGERYAQCFPNFIKAYVRSDVIGAEIAGAYKNVIAIASGICDGLKLGNNAKASLLSRGLVEMARFGKFFNAKQETFLGLSGSGDLFLTSNSTMSRNYRVGLALANGEKLNDILGELGEVAEGVYSAKSITEISKKHNLHTPIANEVQAILEGGEVLVGLRNLLSKK